MKSIETKEEKKFALEPQAARRHSQFLKILGLCMASLTFGLATTHASIIVTDHDTTAPTDFVVAENSAPYESVFGFRQGYTHGQTFVIGSSDIVLNSIFFGYRGDITGDATSTTITLTVDAGHNSTANITEQFTITPASITQGGAAGLHWLELDVSSHNLTLSGNITHSFLLTANTVVGAADTWLIAPSYTRDDQYTSGAVLGHTSGWPDADANFAISAIPEPATFAMIGGLLALALVASRRVRRTA